MIVLRVSVSCFGNSGYILQNLDGEARELERMLVSSAPLGRLTHSSEWEMGPTTASGFLGSQSQDKFTFCFSLHCAGDGGTEEVWYLGCRDKNDT